MTVTASCCNKVITANDKSFYCSTFYCMCSICYSLANSKKYIPGTLIQCISFYSPLSRSYGSHEPLLIPSSSDGLMYMVLSNTVVFNELEGVEKGWCLAYGPLNNNFRKINICRVEMWRTREISKLDA